jgi:hypothetical protein
VVTAPTLVANYESSSWFTAGSPVNITGVSASVGDVLVANYADYNYNGTEVVTFANTVTAQTWTKYTATAGTALNDVFLQQASAIAGAVLSSVTVSETGTAADVPGGSVVRFSGSDGIGAAARLTGNGVAQPSLSITTTFDNSAIVYVIADWAATTGTPTHRTVNGFTPTAGNGQQLSYATNASNGTLIVAYIPDAGTAGAKAVGITAPATGDCLVVALEVRGTGAAAAIPPNLTMAPIRR